MERKAEKLEKKGTENRWNKEINTRLRPNHLIMTQRNWPEHPSSQSHTGRLDKNATHNYVLPIRATL